jgi:Transposase domain (DUF772)
LHRITHTRATLDRSGAHDPDADRWLRVCNPLGAAYLAEVQVNLAYRWFCKLGIEDSIPDHSVLCRARHERFRESDALRRVFEGVVAKCIAAGLVGGEGFSTDASLIKADVDKTKRVPGDQPIAWPKADEASRAVREYLMALDAAHSDEESGGDDSGSSGGGSKGKPPKEVSLTDPQAAWIARKGTDPFFANHGPLSSFGGETLKGIHTGESDTGSPSLCGE